MSLLQLQILVAALAIAQSFPIVQHHSTPTHTSSSSSSSSYASRRRTFLSNKSAPLFSTLEDTTTTQQQEQAAPENYITARGDGSSGGGGVPMNKSTRQSQESTPMTVSESDDNDNDDQLVRPKVGAPMPIGRPSWFRVPAPSESDKSRYVAVKESLSTLSLNTVCEEAQCPNIGECWNGGTGTIMLLGDTCTRGCMFCAVKTDGKPPEPDPFEPFKVNYASQRLFVLWFVVAAYILFCTSFISRISLFINLIFQDCRGSHQMGS